MTTNTESMRFSPLPFERMSEADVREDVLVPLLSALGYRTGTQYDVRRELTLRYPMQSLGRRSETDPILRGRADYVLKVNGELCWVLEAKSPVADVGAMDIEQAWTYATHPEVRAAYFALSNGREFVVFDSFAPPQAREILRVSYSDFDARFDEILHVLGPAAIERQIALRATRRGMPLGPGLGSIAQIASGLVKYHQPGTTAIHPNLQTIVLGGTVQRDEAGHVVVHLDTQAPLPGMQEINDRIGFSGIDLRSSVPAPSLPSVGPLELRGESKFKIPAGETLIMPGQPSPFTVPLDFDCSMTLAASGTLDVTCRFHGTWRGALTIRGTALNSMLIDGTFFVRLV